MKAYNTNRILSYVFALGAGITGAGGILYALNGGMDPYKGMPTLLNASIIAAVIGGVGSVTGAVFGAFILGFAENFGIWKISAEWKPAISFLLLLI